MIFSWLSSRSSVLIELVNGFRSPHPGKGREPPWPLTGEYLLHLLACLILQPGDPTIGFRAGFCISRAVHIDQPTPARHGDQIPPEKEAGPVITLRMGATAVAEREVPWATIRFLLQVGLIESRMFIEANLSQITEREAHCEHLIHPVAAPVAGGADAMEAPE
jgi:hypothetical protein